jgi:hypothetical protein
MPAKTGVSHSLAAFASLVVGSVVSKYVWTYAPSLAEAGAVTGRYVAAAFGAPFSRDLAGGLVVVLALSFAWGVLYHLGRHGG